jgi:hypothetical protein
LAKRPKHQLGAALLDIDLGYGTLLYCIFKLPRQALLAKNKGDPLQGRLNCFHNGKSLL